MADVNLLLPAFGVTWAANGSVAVIDEAQWLAGWAFIGSTPPSVEQFNKVMQVQDQKSNFLYGQITPVLTAGGQVPALNNPNALRDAIVAMAGGRILNIQTRSTTGLITPTAGAKRWWYRGCGAGGGGGGAPNPGTASSAAAAGGGSAGSFGEGLVAAPSGAVTATIGTGGAGNTNGTGGTGGATSLGAIATFPGGPGAVAAFAAGVAQTTGTQGGLSGIPTGGSLYAAVPGWLGEAGRVDGGSFGRSGKGGDSPYGSAGGGIASSGTTGLNGFAASGYGAGGSGAIVTGNNGASNAGGSGTSGLVIVIELG